MKSPTPAKQAVAQQLDANTLLDIITALAAALKGNPARTEAPCACCAGQANGIVYCFDGAVQVFPFPTTEGTWVPVYTAGTGWGWVNAAPLVAHGTAARKPPRRKNAPEKV